MNNIPLGMIVEITVSILLALTIAYCFILNKRLKALQQDKNALKQMVADLVRATNLANNAIVSLRESANEADVMLSSRLSEAEKFAGELAHHVNSGQAVLDRIAQITQAARSESKKEQTKPTSANAALEKLRQYQLRRENAA